MGFLYVADGVNNRIQKFTSRGKFVKAWGREGPGKGEFREVSSVAVDDDGNVYAADTWNQRIQVFDDEGNYISEIKDDFYGPRNVAVNWRKNVYVADTGMRRVALYDKTGKKIIDSRKFEKTGGVKLGEVYGLAIDSDNRVIVTDSECRPYIYSERLYRIKASDDEKMAVRGNVWPFIAVDKYNFIYLVDTNNKEVLVGRIIGNDIVKLGDIVFDEQDFLVGPIGIAADIRGNVYIADDAKKRIIRFTPKYSMDWFIKMDYYVSRAFGLIMRLFI
jgi:DNA-binding beta-propeller fold protein YncE